MGEMKRAIAREEQERTKVRAEQTRMTDRFASTLVIAASIIAAVRLAREPDISRPSPRLKSVISDSIGLAEECFLKALCASEGSRSANQSGIVVFLDGSPFQRPNPLLIASSLRFTRDLATLSPDDSSI
jgi:hypothetical protein